MITLPKRTTVIFLILVVCSLSADFDVYGDAEISVTPDILVGDVRKGGIRTFEFILHNSGDKDLLIDNVQKSCGCTQTILEQAAVVPGASGALTIIYENSGDAAIYSTYVVVNSNAKTSPGTILKIGGNVEDSTVYFEPRSISISAIQGMQTKSAVIKVKSRSNGNVQIIDYVIRDAVFQGKKTAEHPFRCSSNAETQTITIDVLLSPLDTGKYFAVLDVKVNVDGILERYELPLHLTLLPEVAFYPESLSLKIGKESTQSEHRITVKSNSGKPLRIKSVTCPVAWIDVSFRTASDTMGYIYVKASKNGVGALPRATSIDLIMDLGDEEMNTEYFVKDKSYF